MVEIQIGTEINSDLWDKFKIHCIKNKKSIKEMIEELLKKEVERK